MSFDIMLYVVIFLTGLAVSAYIYSSYMLRKKKKSSKIVFNNRIESSQSKLHRFAKHLYNRLSKHRLGRRIIRTLRERYEISALYNEEEIRYRTVLSFIVLGMLILVTLTIVLFFNRSIQSSLVYAILVYMVSRSTSNIVILNMRKKLLLDQVELNKAIRGRYYEYGYIDDALEEAADDVMSMEKEQVGRQAYKISQVLQSKNIDEDIQEFNSAAPNKYLKLLLGLSFLTQEYGDSTTNGISTYTTSLKLLNQEIRMEYNKKDKTGYVLNFIDIMIMLPLLLVFPLINWQTETFYQLQIYFNSSYGLLSMLGVYTVALLSYITLLRAREDTDEKDISRAKDHKIPKWVKYIISGLKPMKHTRRTMKIQKRLREAKANRNIDQYYMKKIAYSIGGFLLTIVLLVTIHQIEHSNILNFPTLSEEDLQMGLSVPTDEVMDSAMDTTVFDNEIIDNAGTEEEIRYYLEGKNLESSEIEAITERVLIKIEELKNERFKWYEYLLALFIGVIAFVIPDAILEIRRRIYKAEEDDEISLFNSLILMLIDTAGVDTYEILVWLCLFSRVFREELEVAITEYDAGPTKSLEKLLASVENENFKELISNLVKSSNDLTLKEAFDELVSDKEYFYEIRREENERLITKKKAIANYISLATISAVILIYMILPIVYLSLSALDGININTLN